MNELRIDALLPTEIARRAEYIGVRKTEISTMRIFALALLAGAFIAMGAVFQTTVATGTEGQFPYGVTKLLVGLVFSLGLVLVVIGGAELFAGSNLIVMAWASGKISAKALLRNWLIVYLGNFVGAVSTALLVFLSKQYIFSDGGVGITALNIANSKVELEFIPALVLGILCNALVCLAVWLTFSARSVIDKIAAIIFPISAFVAAGFEHSVANMYFVPMGLFIKNLDPAFYYSTGLALPNLTWGAFFIKNLLPVTIGNIIGGSLFVAGIYWVIFLREIE
ncbi:MAG: formate transporter FocA [Chloroflexi bacterium]|jgi:formate transporter|nr:formate transporter FocA [Chloroflexota bacterium]